MGPSSALFPLPWIHLVHVMHPNQWSLILSQSDKATGCSRTGIGKKAKRPSRQDRLAGLRILAYPVVSCSISLLPPRLSAALSIRGIKLSEPREKGRISATGAYTRSITINKDEHRRSVRGRTGRSSASSYPSPRRDPLLTISSTSSPSCATSTITRAICHIEQLRDNRSI